MAGFEFPSHEEMGRQRQTGDDFQRQVQELLDQARESMVRRGPTQGIWGYLRFPPGVSKDIQEAVRDAINAVNGGRDWDARLSTDEGAPVLVVYGRKN
ncbi:MAG TPA: hypothetical protein VFZ58_04845 [Candidatus Saccharimonadales bacterium]